MIEELDANGAMTDVQLAEISRIEHITSLKLGNSKKLTDAGLRHLANMPQLQHLDISHTAITDAGLSVLRDLPKLETLSLLKTNVTDSGLANIQYCDALQRLNVMWTDSGDGAIRALAGQPNFTHFWSGNNITDRGLALLHELPVFKQWRGGKATLDLMSYDAGPNLLALRGQFTDAGMNHLRGLDGLFGLNLDDSRLTITARGIAPLVSLANLGRLAVDAKNDWMPHIANMPALRFLGAQDTTATDDGWTALSTSQSIEFIWGRRCHGLQASGFRSLGNMPKLRGLSVSCLNVDEAAIATLPDFPSLRDLMPMDIPDAGYRHIGKCSELESLVLMYCHDTTDKATEHITGLSKLKRYFNSYTTITDRTPELLSSMNSLEEITFDACHALTNEGIVNLSRLPGLKTLRVAGRKLTPALKSAFAPTVSVHYSH